MITKLETAYNIARAIRSSDHDALWTGQETFTQMLADQGNEITQKGSVRIGNRFCKISTLWADTFRGGKNEYSRLS